VRCQAKIVNKFVPGLGGKTDPIGPSPLIIHVEQLKAVVKPWREFTKQVGASRSPRAQLLPVPSPRAHLAKPLPSPAAPRVAC
jgi:hypothetical protein